MILPYKGACPESTDSRSPLGSPRSHRCQPAPTSWHLRLWGVGLPSDASPLPVLGMGKCQQMVSLNSCPPWGQPCDVAGGCGGVESLACPRPLVGAVCITPRFSGYPGADPPLSHLRRLTGVATFRSAQRHLPALESAPRLCSWGDVTGARGFLLCVAASSAPSLLQRQTHTLLNQLRAFQSSVCL